MVRPLQAYSICWCLQVAWQSLLDEGSEGSVSDDSGTGKASIAGAVLTHRRLLIVSATLSVLTVHVPSPAAASITSFLWLGPALLFCNAAHQVGTASLTACILPFATGILLYI